MTDFTVMVTLPVFESTMVTLTLNVNESPPL